MQPSTPTILAASAPVYPFCQRTSMSLSLSLVSYSRIPKDNPSTRFPIPNESTEFVDSRNFHQFQSSSSSIDSFLTSPYELSSSRQRILLLRTSSVTIVSLTHSLSLFLSLSLSLLKRLYHFFRIVRLFWTPIILFRIKLLDSLFWPVEAK